MVIGSSVSRLSVSSCVFEYNDPNDYFDVSNHEVDRQDDLEYEVRKLQLHFQQPNDTKWKNSKNSFGSFSHSLTQWLSSTGPHPERNLHIPGGKFVTPWKIHAQSHMQVTYPDEYVWNIKQGSQLWFIMSARSWDSIFMHFQSRVSPVKDTIHCFTVKDIQNKTEHI